MITAKINKDNVSAEVFWSGKKVGTAYRTEPLWADVDIYEDENWWDEDLAKWCERVGNHDDDYPPMEPLMDDILWAITLAHKNKNSTPPKKRVKIRQQLTSIMVLGDLTVALDVYNSPYMRLWAKTRHPNTKFSVLANGSQIMFDKNIFDREKIGASDMTKYSYLSGDYIVAMTEGWLYEYELIKFITDSMVWKKYTP